MARVVVTETARVDLDHLIRRHSLPPSTAARVRAALEPLRTFPLLGRGLEGRWSELRVVLGPWPWMLLVYRFDADADQVAIVTIQDGRSASAATSER